MQKKEHLENRGRRGGEGERGLFIISYIYIDTIQ